MTLSLSDCPFIHEGPGGGGGGGSRPTSSSRGRGGDRGGARGGFADRGSRGGGGGYQQQRSSSSSAAAAYGGGSSASDTASQISMDSSEASKIREETYNQITEERRRRPRRQLMDTIIVEGEVPAKKAPGNAGQPVVVLSNHYPLTIEQATIYRYLIDFISPEAPPEDRDLRSIVFSSFRKKITEIYGMLIYLSTYLSTCILFCSVLSCFVSM
jgi:hypothetical protein